MTQHNSHLSRRIALRTVSGAVLLSLTGCLNTSDSSGTSSNTSLSSGGKGPIQRVTIDGTTLVVKLSEDAEVDQVNLIQPNGELFDQHSIATGVRQVTSELGTSYPPGEYRITVLSDEETVEESSLSIQPRLRVVEMGIGKNQPGKMWDESSSKITKEAFVSVENQGNGPDAITQLLFIGDVPYPSDEKGTNYANNNDISGIYSPEEDTEVGEVLIEPKEQVTLYSYRSPFAFVRGEGTSCESQEQNGEFDLILETQVDPDQIVEKYNIQYSPSDEFDNCEITITEE